MERLKKEPVEQSNFEQPSVVVNKRKRSRKQLQAITLKMEDSGTRERLLKLDADLYCPPKY